jgi:hypothetical protein
MGKDRKTARLIPTSEKKELRATSALLAALTVVRPFSKALLAETKASKASRAEVTAEIEPSFQPKGKRPDGLIEVYTGRSKTFVALVETKVGSGRLNAQQVKNYLSIARSNRFDCLITISNEISPAPGLHPTNGVKVRKNSSVQVLHLSWAKILAVATKIKNEQKVGDPEQAWILDELIYFLEHKSLGAMEFESMGRSWPKVRDGAATGELQKGDAVIDIAQRWDQLLAFLSLRLGSEIGQDVEEIISRREQSNPYLRTERFVRELTEKNGVLSGKMRVPDAVGEIDLLVSVGALKAHISTTIDAPKGKKSRGSVSWLIKQLELAPGSLMIKSNVGGSWLGPVKLSKVRIAPDLLIGDRAEAISGFKIINSYHLGKNSADSGKKKGFSSTLLKAVLSFYDVVLRVL